MTQVTLDNGFSTRVPGIYVNRKRRAQGSPASLEKVLAVIGDFPFLAAGEPEVFRSESAMLDRFGDFDVVRAICATVFRGTADPNINRAPQRVVLGSTYSAEAAAAYLVDSLGRQLVKLTAATAGEAGNALAYSLAAASPDTVRRNLTLVKSAEQRESYPTLGSGPVVEVTMAHGTLDYALLSAIPFWDDTRGARSAEVVLTVGKVITIGTSYAVPADLRGIAGRFTLSPTMAVTAETDVLITGLINGVETTVTVTLPIGAMSVAVPDAFSRLDNIAVEETAWTGAVIALWAAVIVTEARASNLAALAGRLRAHPAVTATVKNPRAGVLKMGELDLMLSTTVAGVAANLRADTAELVRQVNAGSRFVEASFVESESEGLEFTTHEGVTSLAASTAVAVPATYTPVAGSLLGIPVITTGAGALQWVGRVASVVETTVAAASDGVDLASAPADITVANAASLPATGCVLVDVAGGEKRVLRYSSKTPTTIAGLSGEMTGVLATGGVVRAVLLTSAVPFSVWKSSAYAVATPPRDITQAATLANFTGGSTGTLDAESRTALFEALLAERPSTVNVLTQDPTTIRGAYDYAVNAAGVGAAECNVWAGLSHQATLDTLSELVGEYNSEHIAFCAESVLLDDGLGGRRWFGPEWQALQLAAAQASIRIGLPLSRKYMRCYGTRSHVSWNGTRDKEDTIAAGLVTYERTALGFRVVRSVTSYRADSDLTRIEVSANESAYWSTRDLRAYLDSQVATANVDFDSRGIVGMVTDRLRFQVTSKIIAAVDESTIAIDGERDDVSRVGYEYSTVVPNNFLILEPAAVASRGAVTLP